MKLRTKRRKKKLDKFKFLRFSRKQKKLIYWWLPGSGHEDQDTVIADGAIRSGKTIAMICGFLLWSKACFQGESFIIAGKSMGALKRNVIKPLLRIVRAWGWSYDYNRSANELVIEGNTYYLFGAVNEASQDVLQGLTAAGAYADDVALFPQSFVDQMIGRCSVAGSKIWMNCNPRGPSHYFLKEYIQKAVEKQIYYLHFMLDDNLTLDPKIKERYKRMYTGVFYRRYILGQWAQAEGLIYTGFDKARHVWKQAQLDSWIKHNPIVHLTAGVDFGGSGSATVYTLVGFTRNWKKAIVLDEYFDPNNISSEHVIKMWVKKVELWKNMYPRLSDAFLDHEMLLVKSFRTATPQINVRLAKKSEIYDRIVATDMMMALDKLVIMDHCEHLIESLESAVWNEKKGNDYVRLDDGTVNIDSLDSFEYACERYYRDILRV